MSFARTLRRGSSCVVIAIAASSCAVISPPPLMSQLAGTVPNAPGDMRLMVALGFGGDILGGQGFGGEIRFEEQVNAWASIGGGLSAGFDRNDDSSAERRNQPTWIYGARGWGRFNPAAVDWVALTPGVGISGTNTGTVALTLDGSAMFGGAIDLDKAPAGQAFRLSPYGGPMGAISIPLRQGRPFQRKQFLIGFGPDVPTSNISTPISYATTYFWGMRGGLAADSGRLPAWTGALEFSLLYGFSGSETAALFAIATGQGARMRR